jgi:hypothetical protein
LYPDELNPLFYGSFQLFGLIRPHPELPPSFELDLDRVQSRHVEHPAAGPHAYAPAVIPLVPHPGRALDIAYPYLFPYQPHPEADQDRLQSTVAVSEPISGIIRVKWTMVAVTKGLSGESAPTSCAVTPMATSAPARTIKVIQLT